MFAEFMMKGIVFAFIFATITTIISYIRHKKKGAKTEERRLGDKNKNREERDLMR